MIPTRWLRAVVILVLSFVASAASAQTAPPIRIMPLGDSITYGASAAGGYRNRLYQILTAAGYNVDFVGTQTSNGVGTLPDSDHEGHSGWRIDQLDTNIAGWFGAIADPDVVLLHIGTNDFGQGVDTVNAINRLDALISKIATLRPYAHIIVTNLMERAEPYNTAIQTQFNPYVQDRVNAQAAFGRRVTFLDMRSAVPITDMPDQLHPNQTGYDKMANAWLPAIQAVSGPLGDSAPPAVYRARGSVDRTHVVVTFSKPVADSAASMGNFSLDGGLTISSAQLDSTKRQVTLTTSAQAPNTSYTVTVNGVTDRTANSLALAPNTTASFFAATPTGYAVNVPESAGYTLAYSVDLPSAADYKNFPINYAVDNHSAVGPFDRVAYYLELQTIAGDVQYVWASMDAFTTDSGKIAVPTAASGALFQQGVTGLNVVSNVSSLATGSNLTGNLEFWPTNYGAENTPAPGVPGASDATYDFGDHPTPGTYGSMQLHNAGAGQTIFAFNNWGGATAAGDIDLGIGNNPAPTRNGIDWTFAQNGASYAVRRLQVLVRTVGDVVSPTLVSANASFGRTKVTVTFSEPLAPQSVQTGNFALNGNVLVLGATLAPNQRDVILTTTAQPQGTPLTLTVNNVRDSSASANRIVPNSTVAVVAPALPPEITANVGAAAAGYQLVYSVNLPTFGNLNSTSAYTYDDRNAPGVFGRVAYYLELQKPGGPVQFVWTSMDAFTPFRTKIGVPTVSSGAVFQQNVTNLDVISNVSGVVNGTAMAGGNIEFWPNDYSAANGANVANASATNYDFGDTRTATGGANYGSMQVHNHDSAASQTVFAVNHFGADGNPLDMGIGNNPAPVKAGVDWTFAANADTYTRRVLHVLVLPVQPTLPASVAANVPEAAGYQLAYSINIPASGNLTSLVYSADNHNDIGQFSRVAYYLELQTGTATPNYIWTSMDAFTADPTKIAIPTPASGAVFQQNVNNLNVVSNVPGIVTGTGMTGGNIEFWPTNYSAPNALNVPNADAASYDFGDTRTTTGTYGSMQVHNHDAAAMQTLFAFNNWGGVSTANNTFCLGIGNNPNPGTAPNRGLDWTFANNAGTYSSRVLHVFVLPGYGDTTGPTIVRATGSTALNRFVVTFSEPVADSAAAVANFAVDGGLTITSATLLPGQRDVALTTSAQTAGTIYTVTVNGVRDRSAGGNLIQAGASVSFTAPVPEPILANIPEAAGYTLAYKLAIPDAAAFNSNAIPYAIDEGRFQQVQAFDRIAYCVELQLSGGGASSWVYVSADAFTGLLAQVGVPNVASGAIFQQNLTNMNVFASAGAAVTTGTGLPGGNIEFWPNDYTAANGLGIPNASATNFDFGDTRSTAVGYGSMQIHNHDASQTVFAFNNWGGKSGNNDLGIGNDPAPVTAGVDWTFHHNAPTYSTKNLYVFVRPGGTLSGAVPRLYSQPTSRTLNAGDNTTLAVAASGTGTLYYQWRFNGNPIAGATNPWLDVNGFTAAQAGTYDVVVSTSGSASVTSGAATLTLNGATNRPPTFGGYAFTTRTNEAVLVTRGSLLAKASDADGDTLSVSAVSAATAQGGTASLGASGVTYTPAAGYVGSDSFTVTVSDGKGGSVQGTVSVTVTSAAGIGSAQSTISVRTDGKVDVAFRGTAGNSYRVERSVDLSNWTVVATVSAGDDGVVPFTDPAPPAGRAFYRTRATAP